MDPGNSGVRLVSVLLMKQIRSMQKIHEENTVIVKIENEAKLRFTIFFTKNKFLSLSFC
jgi:hypothetical protein